MQASYHTRNTKAITKVCDFAEIIEQMETNGERLKRIRNARGLTQHELAKLAGTSQSTIGNIETDLRGYGESIVDIASALKVTPEELRGKDPSQLVVFQSHTPVQDTSIALLIEWIGMIKDPATRKKVLFKCLSIANAAAQEQGQPIDGTCDDSMPETRGAAPRLPQDH